MAEISPELDARITEAARSNWSYWQENASEEQRSKAMDSVARMRTDEAYRNDEIAKMS